MGNCPSCGWTMDLCKPNPRPCCVGWGVSHPKWNCTPWPRHCTRSKKPWASWRTLNNRGHRACTFPMPRPNTDTPKDTLKPTPEKKPSRPCAKRGSPKACPDLPDTCKDCWRRMAVVVVGWPVPKIRPLWIAWPCPFYVALPVDTLIMSPRLVWMPTPPWSTISNDSVLWCPDGTPMDCTSNRGKHQRTTRGNPSFVSIIHHHANYPP
mmetsp:Transcript_7518/g.14263  ORF Transcript_7518/g.14263 Transcript_7518/m.14263 type:complete len:208 (+) Transcript_7518:267-890(+)